jgi:curved DNA binding protein
MDEELKKVYNSKKSKKMERGISFPTCISVNETMGHFSPLKDDSFDLKEGDVAKIMTGCHFDGFAGNAAVTHVVGEGKVADKVADVVMAAHHAHKAAQRKIKEGGTNSEVTAAIAAVCESYKVNAVEGVLSHKVKKHCLDGNDVIINKETGEQRVEEFEFVPGDIIGLDVYVSSGEGKPKESEKRCTVFKRELNAIYNLKINASRKFFTECNKRFPTLPFALRQFEDVTSAKVGVTECMNHDLVMPFPVLTEKAGEIVAQFSSTVVVLPRSTAVLAGDIAVDEERFAPANPISSEEVKELVTCELFKKEDKKKVQKSNK